MIRSVALLAAATAVALGAACALTPDSYRGAAAPRAEAIVPLKSARPVLGLALGGGGARGFAHIGVIKALEDAGIVPDVVTGASSGAVIAALYAGGHDGRRLTEIARDLNRTDLVDFVLIGRGWVRGEALQDFVNRMVGDRPIERLARPFAVVATAAKSGRMTVFNRGNTGLAVRASASVPELFIAPVIEGEEFVDGGLTSPVPVKVARAMGADVVIAVDVSWFAQVRGRDPAGDGMARYGRSVRYGLLNDELAAADVVVSPRTVPTRMLDFEQKEANIAAGEEAARAVLPDLKAALARAAAGKSAAAAAAPAAN
jgi:NTE family protein